MAGSESKQKVLGKIEEFINEENKIVIYKWLSRTLSIDVNTAKHYLYCFVEENKSKYPINVCYLLSGIQEKADNTKVHKVIVTSQDKLEDSKSSFSTLTSFHVYSVQLSKIQDASILYTAEVVSNKNLEDQQKYSAVKYDNVRILPKRKSFEAKTSDKIQTTKKDQKEPVKLQPPPPPPPKQKQNGLFSLWQKQQSNSTKLEKKETEVKSLKSSVINNAEKKTKLEKKETEVKPLKSSVIGNAEKKGTKQLPAHQENNTETKKLSSKKEDFKTKKFSTRENERKTEGKLSLKSIKQRRKKDQEHVLSSDEETGKQTNKKRHKRILQISESESEPEEESSEEDLALQSKKLKICEESSDENNLEEDDESLIPETNNSTCSYKTVNKTYVDEHGFMVTKKIKECIRESPKKEEKLPIQETNSIPSVVQSENLNPVQKKQASLMNFFMKK